MVSRLSVRSTAFMGHKVKKVPDKDVEWCLGKDSGAVVRRVRVRESRRRAFRYGREARNSIRAPWCG